MNKTQDKFSLPAVTLSIFAAAAAERLPVCSSPRALLWQEVLAAVLLMILSALVSRFWQSGPPKSAAWAAAFCLQVWLAVELAGTFWKALQVCREEFSSLALLGFLPLLLWAGWQMPARAWGAPAQVLWWFVAVGSAVGLLGLALNVPCNYVLIYGKLGLPQLGAVGCGVATALCLSLIHI